MSMNSARLCATQPRQGRHATHHCCRAARIEHSRIGPEIGQQLRNGISLLLLDLIGPYRASRAVASAWLRPSGEDPSRFCTSGTGRDFRSSAWGSVPGLRSASPWPAQRGLPDGTHPLLLSAAASPPPAAPPRSHAGHPAMPVSAHTSKGARQQLRQGRAEGPGQPSDGHGLPDRRSGPKSHWCLPGRVRRRSVCCGRLNP